MILRDENGRSWGLCKMRKTHVCKGCNYIIPRGDEAFRPYSWGGERKARVCIDCAANGTCLFNLSAEGGSNG